MSERAPGADAVGATCTLTVIAPVEPGQEEALRAELGALGQGRGSPFALVPGTHLARFVVIDRLREVTLRRHHLLFSAVYDPPWDGFLPAVHDALGDLVGRIWGHCGDYPEDASAEAFTAWMLARRIPARAIVPAYPQATLADVRDALDLRRRIATFAARHQGRSAEEVHSAFRKEFVPR